MSILAKKKFTSLVLTGAMLVSTMAGLTVTASADTVANLSAVDTISTGGTYLIDENSLITVATSDPVTLQGDANKHAVTINCNVAADLTIDGLQISAPYAASSISSETGNDANIINFENGINTLTLKGENLIENDSAKTTGTDPQNPADKTGSINGAAVRVAPDADLNVEGDGTLYMYKHSMGAGFGGNTNEANGDITFDHTGAIFAKGSMTGPVIGGDVKTGTLGKIVINNGFLNIEANARGAGIGGSSQGIGAEVTISENANVNIICGWTGYAIGNGGSAANKGNLIINGGSLKVSKTSDNNRLDSDKLINANINGKEYPGGLACLTVPIENASINDIFNVYVGESEDPFYTGKVNRTQYVENPVEQNPTTQDYWNKTGGASAVYLWLPTSVSLDDINVEKA